MKSGVVSRLTNASLGHSVDAFAAEVLLHDTRATVWLFGKLGVATRGDVYSPDSDSEDLHNNAAEQAPSSAHTFPRSSFPHNAYVTKANVALCCLSLALPERNVAASL